MQEENKKQHEKCLIEVKKESFESFIIEWNTLQTHGYEPIWISQTLNKKDRENVLILLEKKHD